MPDAKPHIPPNDSKNNHPRILLLVTQSDWGGVQSFLVRFAAGLQAEGHEVLLAAGGEGELWHNASEAGIRMHKLQDVVREISPLRDLSAISEIRKLIDSYRPDAVHLNSSKMGVLGSIAARYSDAKPRVVYRIGGWSFLEPIAGWKKSLYRWAEKATAPLKDVVITVHPGDELLAEKIGIKPKTAIRTVPNGLDVQEFFSQLEPRSEARSKLGLPETAFVYGTVANAYATKGLIPYLDVVKRITDARPDAWFIILGDGPEFDALKQRCDDLKLDRLILTGHRDDANRLYPAFDAFVLPSRKEGMPWTILESMASGIPIISTDVGACRWMLQADSDHPAGIVVPPDDADALVSALASLHQDADLRHRLTQSGPDIVKRNFTWQATYQGNRNALL